jgi:hypothetical protein
MKLENNLLVALPAILFGFGVNTLITPIAFLLSLIFCYLRRRHQFNIQLIFYGFFYSLFFALYPIFYEKNLPGLDSMTFGFGYWIWMASILVITCILSLLNYTEKIAFVLWLSFGMLLKSISIVLASLAILSPPYYQNIYDIYFGGVGNSVSYANAICYFTFSYILFPDHSAKVFGIKVWGGLFLVVSIISALLLSAKTYFLILIFCIVYKSFHFSTRKKVYSFLGLLVVLGFAFLIHSLGALNNSLFFIFERLTTVDFSSGRFEIYQYYLEALKVDLIKPEMDPKIHFWFHNIFMDIHSSSGIYLAIYFFILTILPFFLMLKKRMQFNFSNGSVLSYLIVIAIFSTSIPLEGKEHASLFYFLAISSTFFIKIQNSKYQIVSKK